MKNNKLNFLSVSICALSSTLWSEAQCMTPQDQRFIIYPSPKPQASTGPTLKRPRENENGDAVQSKKARFEDDELENIRRIYEKKEKRKEKKKEALESKRKELATYFDGNTPPKNPEDAYNVGINYAFYVNQDMSDEKEERFKKAIRYLKEAADKSKDPEKRQKASYCLAIFYTMGWGSNEPHSKNQENFLGYIKKSGRYEKAEKLFEAYKKTPPYAYNCPENEYKKCQQQFSQMFKSPEKHEFEMGLFKIFGWGIPQDIEGAVKHLLRASPKDSEDAYVILYLLRINEDISIPQPSPQGVIDVRFFNEPSNYSLTEGKIDHIDIIKDYHNLLERFSKKQEIGSKIEEVESEIKKIKIIKSKCTDFLNENGFESLTQENRENNILQHNDRMDIEVNGASIKSGPQSSIRPVTATPKKINNYAPTPRTTNNPTDQKKNIMQIQTYTG